MIDPYAPQPATTAAPMIVIPADGRTLAVIGLIVDFFFPPVGLILCFTARSQSRKAAVPHGVATLGIVLGILFTGGALVLGIFFGVLIGVTASECSKLGSGDHQVGSVIYSCS